MKIQRVKPNQTKPNQSKPKQVLLDDPDNGPCREEHRRCRAVVKKVGAGDKLLEAGDVVGATKEWRAATALEPDNAAFLGPLLLRVSWESRVGVGVSRKGMVLMLVVFW